MAFLIVEHSYETPLTEAEHEAVARRLDPCLEAYGARWLRTYLSSDHRRMICEFEAPDAEAIRIAMRNAGASFDAVWVAQRWAIEDPK